MPTAATAVPDLLDPGFWVDVPAAHAALRELRTRGPVVRDDANDLWLVVGHPELLEVERRDADFVSGRGYRSFYAPGEDNMISLDDPRHAEQRQ